jgi:hypothetical protein
MSKTSKALLRILLATASIALTFGIAACNKNQTPDTTAPTQPAQPDQSQDPAATANLAPASETQTTGTNDQPYQNDANANNDYDDEDSSYGQPALEASDAPPELPEYSQPEMSRRWLFVDARKLELFFSRLLLGTGRMGAAARGGLSVDAGLLGIF